MLSNHIRFVKEQISFIDYKIKNNTPNTRSQIKLLTIKLGFEELLEHLKSQEPKDNPQTPPTYVRKSRNNEHPNTQNTTVVKRTRTSQKTKAVEDRIYSIIKESQNGRHVNDIRDIYSERYEESNLSRIKNRVSIMMNERKILEWVSKGVYRVSE